MSEKKANPIAVIVKMPNFFKITKFAKPNTPKPIPKIIDVKNNGLNIILDVCIAGRNSPSFRES